MGAARIRQVMQRNPLLVDLVLVAALVALAVTSGLVLVAPQAQLITPPPAAVIVLWAIALALPLLWRRRFPCTVLAITAVHFPLYWAVGQVNEIASWLVLGVAVYSAAAYGRLPRAAWLAGAQLVGLTGLAVVIGSRSGLLGPVQLVGITVLNALPFLLGWPLGLMTRRLREYREVLERRNAELTAEREANARRAVLEERVRIARELHDVVAHHVSLMGIQAGVAQRLFDSRPDEARDAVAAVQSDSRRVISELQRLLGVLRGPTDAPAGDQDDREATPGLRQLPALVDSVRQAGLPVELDVRGFADDLTPGLELSAYRIVQEALTNTLKHAGSARASVQVRCDYRAVEVEVLDDGRGPNGSAPGDPSGGRGRGLVGMRERVSLHGGRLEAGPRPEGGFRVHATLGEP